MLEITKGLWDSQCSQRANAALVFSRTASTFCRTHFPAILKIKTCIYVYQSMYICAGAIFIAGRGDMSDHSSIVKLLK